MVFDPATAVASLWLLGIDIGIGIARPRLLRACRWANLQILRNSRETRPADRRPATRVSRYSVDLGRSGAPVRADVSVRDGLVLLVHRHPSRRWYPDCWDLVGGHVGTDPADDVEVRPEAEQHQPPGRGLGNVLRMSLKGDIAAIGADLAPRALNRESVVAGPKLLAEQPESLGQVGVGRIGVQIQLAEDTGAGQECGTDVDIRWAVCGYRTGCQRERIGRIGG